MLVDGKQMRTIWVEADGETVYDGAIRAVVPSIVPKAHLPRANGRIEGERGEGEAFTTVTPVALENSELKIEGSPSELFVTEDGTAVVVDDALRRWVLPRPAAEKARSRLGRLRVPEQAVAEMAQPGLELLGQVGERGLFVRPAHRARLRPGCTSRARAVAGGERSDHLVPALVQSRRPKRSARQGGSRRPHRGNRRPSAKNLQAVERTNPRPGCIL